MNLSSSYGYFFWQLSRTKRIKLKTSPRLASDKSLAATVNHASVSDEESEELIGGSYNETVEDLREDIEPDEVGEVMETSENEGSEEEESSVANDVGAAISASTVTGVKKKVKIPGLYKPPTHEELQTLKETQNLFKSNLMRLQVHMPMSVCLSSCCIKAHTLYQLWLLD